MTREEAIKMLEYIKHIGNGESEYKNDAQAIAIDMAIKALEQEPLNDALDKIKAEIQENINYNKQMNYQGIVAGLLLTLNIINKYKGESEEK